MKTNLASWRDEWGYHLLLLIAVFLMLWPIVFMLSTSLKDLNKVFEWGMSKCMTYFSNSQSSA